MSVQKHQHKLPTAVQQEPERFSDAAYTELMGCPMHEHGVCFLPECSKRFQPTRATQMYCCGDCQREGHNEMRKWGHKLAAANLAWGMFKRSTAPNEAELVKASRRHITRITTEWLENRAARKEAALRKVWSQ